MRALKIAGIAVGSLVGLVVLVVAALLLFIDPNDYKGEIAALVKDKTDMDLVIDDKLEWSLWPSLGVKLGKVALSDAQAKETLVAVDKAAVSVQVMPLFSKKIAIDAVLLDGAKVRFIQHADGSTSWDRMLSKLTSDEEEKKSDTVDFNVKQLDVKNTSVLLKDEKAGVERTVEDVTVAASDIGIKKAFPLKLSFLFRQQDAASKTLIAKNALETSITLDQDAQVYELGKLVFTSALSGTLLPAPANVELKSDIRADMKAQQIALKGLALKADYQDKALKSPATVDVSGNVLADLAKTQLTVDALKVKAGWPDAARPSPLTAELATALVTNWADGALNISQLTLNASVPDKAWPKPVTVSYNGPVTGNWKQGDFAIPAFALDAVGVSTKGEVSAKLPALQGTEPDAPITKGMAITGKLATAAFNPRNVMSALAIAAPKTADANVLKSASFSADIAGDEKQVLLKNIRVKLDESTLTGEAGISDLATMRQYARLNLDKMDADRYLPLATPAAKTVAAPASSGSAEVLPVKLLKEQNLDVAFTAGSLKAMEYPVTGFRVAATASNGLVNVSDLKGTIYNGGFSVPVNINVQGAQPVLKLQPSLQHMEIGPLAKKFLKKDLLEGKASYTGNLTVRGNTVDAWMKSVTGTSDLKFENGVLHGVNAMQEAMNALGKYQGLLALAGKDAQTIVDKQKDTEIASFAANNTLDNGVLNSKSLNADLKKGKVNGAGSFNLVTQELDYKFQMNLDKSVVGEKNAAYALPVQCKGNLAGNIATLCKLDSKAISDIALKAATAKGLEKLGLKGGASTPNEAVKQQVDEGKDKAKEKLNEKLNEGLNKLFKR
ncbi:MAG: AsmA family protein [Pedobacter sp.]|nr:AsmA family protein [Pedobacter sp.]